jgi:hypothetical protein
MKKVEIKAADFSMAVPDFSRNRELDDRKFWVRPMDLKIAGESISESLLAGKDDEQQQPELTMAGAMLLRHPLVQTEGWFWGTKEVEGVRQGVFLLTNKETGEKIQYAVRAAERENGEVLVLWGMGYDTGATFGYFETENTGEDDWHWKVKPDTFVTRMEAIFRLEENPSLPRIIIEKMGDDLEETE